MFELLIALFGGIYLIGRTAFDRSEKKYSDNRTKISRGIQELTQDSSKRHELKIKFRENRWECLEEISENLKRVFVGQTWDEILEIYKKAPFELYEYDKAQGTKITSLWTGAFYIYLATHGQSPDYKYYIGFRLPFLDDDTSVKYTIEFLKEIERVLYYRYGDNFLLYEFNGDPKRLLCGYYMDELRVLKIGCRPWEAEYDKKYKNV